MPNPVDSLHMALRERLREEFDSYAAADAVLLLIMPEIRKAFREERERWARMAQDSGVETLAEAIRCAKSIPFHPDEDRWTQPLPFESTRRRCERKQTRVSITLLTESGGRETSHSASTVDLSQLGARIRPSAMLTPGRPVTVRTSDGRWVLCRVVWVGEAKSGIRGEAGLEFLKSLSTPLAV